jgi:hypothetical protein
VVTEQAVSAAVGIAPVVAQMPTQPVPAAVAAAAVVGEPAGVRVTATATAGVAPTGITAAIQAAGLAALVGRGVKPAEDVGERLAGVVAAFGPAGVTTLATVAE